MASFTVQNICGFLIRSRLMTPDEMRAMSLRWQDEAGDTAAQLDRFLKWLVARGYVTEYQANLLGQGHSDDFFLGQYKVMERIGRGRMAGVFKAVHTLGQTVAIKVLPPSKAKNQQMLGRFQREARLSLKLKHANVVRTFQVGESNGLHYLVMECLDGETLDDVLRRRRTLPPNEAVRLAHQALLGLDHIHAQGMVHRDLKPANLMLVTGPAKTAADTTLSATMKILDIGLARELFDENQPGGISDEGFPLTAENVLLGTPDYLAPEQARDPRAIDIRADIYSIGCVLYHMLTGQPPFPDRNILSQIFRHATEEPRSLREFNPAIPEGLEQIVAWMMKKKPADRYPTPGRAAQALEMYQLVEKEAPVEEAPQMRKFLTWLETEAEAPTDAITIPPPDDFPAPVAIAAPAAAPAKPKLAQPVVATAAPVAAAPVAAAPVAAPVADGFDFGQLNRPSRSRRRGKNGTLLLVLAAAFVLLTCVCGGVGYFLVRRFLE